MGKWLFTVKIKHLLTENDGYDSVRNTMMAIGMVLKDHSVCFAGFSRIEDFFSIPVDEDYLEYANNLLDCMYNYADENRIWIA